jgi:hypothetical protein
MIGKIERQARLVRLDHNLNRLADVAKPRTTGIVDFEQSEHEPLWRGSVGAHEASRSLS